jgi:hypothetical protein
MWAEQPGEFNPAADQAMRSLGREWNNACISFAPQRTLKTLAAGVN